MPPSGARLMPLSQRPFDWSPQKEELQKHRLAFVGRNFRILCPVFELLSASDYTPSRNIRQR